ncbi:MAG: MMPL family transporter [SAR324 cluster bacterium]|nr:MMPL family transporter [SAR324 cluster bacterium]
MKKIIQNIESKFEQIGRWINVHPKRVILVMLLFFAILASNLVSIEVDTSTEAFFSENDQTRITYNKFREQFGRDEIVLALIHPKNVFDIEFLKKLKSFHEDLEAEVPHLDEVQSLINVTAMRGEGGDLIIEELMADWPDEDAEVMDLKDRVLRNKFYRNFLVSEDGQYTTVVVRSNAFSDLGIDLDQEGILEERFLEEEGMSFSDNEKSQLLTDEQNSEFVEAIKSLADRHRNLDFPIELGGSPIMVHDLNKAMFSDMPIFVLASLGLIALLLLVIFRRLSGLLLPILTVILSLLTALGLLGLTETKLTVVMQILPSFLLAVGIGYSIHLLVIYYRHLREHGDKGDAIAFAMGHSGLAILITSLTTAGGLLSFVPVKVAPVSDLGLYGAAGVMLCVFFTLVLLPALLSVLPEGKSIVDGDKLHEKEKSQRPISFADRILKSCGNFAVNHPWKVIVVSTLIALISSFGATQLRFSHNPVAWLPDNHSLRNATDAINDHMKGSASIELVVERDEEDAVKDPEFMKRLDEFNRFSEGTSHNKIVVGKSSSVVDVVKEINQVLNEDREESYKVPIDRGMIAQELLLFENGGTDDLENLVDTPFSKARVTLKTTWVDANQYTGLLLKLEKKIDELFGQEKSYVVTGLIPIMVKTITFVMEGMLISYLIAGVVITLLMIFLLADLRLGLWSMIPNFLPILAGLGLMGMLNMPLDAMSILVGSIAIGLAVDDTVHFMHNFRRNQHIHQDIQVAVEKTLTSTGRAMLLTTIVLSAGFFIFTISSMNNLISFGLITGMTIIIALLGDILLAPAMMALIYKNRTSNSTK